MNADAVKFMKVENYTQIIVILLFRPLLFLRQHRNRFYEPRIQTEYLKAERFQR